MMIFSSLITGLALAGAIVLKDAPWISDEPTNADLPSEGEIRFKSNDARHKAGDSFRWLAARSSQKLHLRDSIFTGADSLARLAMKNGDVIDMGAHTMMVMTRFQRVVMPNLDSGNFTVSSPRGSSFLLRGRMVTLERKNAKLQVVVDKHKPPRMRLLSGQARVKLGASEKPVELKVGEYRAMSEIKESMAFAAVNPMTVLVPPPEPPPVPEPPKRRAPRFIASTPPELGPLLFWQDRSLQFAIWRTTSLVPLPAKRNLVPPGRGQP